MRHRILIPLLSDPTMLRESSAIAAGEGRFRLVRDRSQREQLQFKPGELVECEIRALPDGSKGLVAVRSVSADAEYRSRRNVFIVTGAIVGALLGAVFATWIAVSLDSILIGAALGASIFAFCSARWGDAAWVALSQILDWP